MVREVKDIKNKIETQDRTNTIYIHPIMSQNEVAKYICAFSNSNGGDIIFGVKDDGKTLTPKSFPFEIDVQDIEDLLDGEIILKTSYFMYESKDLFYISIDKSQKIIQTNNVPYKLNENGEIEVMRKKSVFISYTHKDSDLVDRIEEKLQTNKQFELKRDINETAYRDDLDQFMKSIREHDCVIAVVSSAYIKSLNCMYEITNLMKDENFTEKLFFIVVGKEDHIYYSDEKKYEGFESKVYNVLERLKYIKYWEDQKAELARSVDEAKLPLEKLGNLANYKKKMDSVAPSTDDFIEYLCNKVGRSFNEMYVSDFKEIVEAIENVNP